MITSERLKQFLRYDCDTGLFFWLVKKGRGEVGAQAGVVHHSGYLQIGIDGKLYLAHRLAWLYAYGVMPPHEIDHENRNRLDNRIFNLRKANRKQNAENVPALRKNNTSGFRGVFFQPRTDRWYAQIRHHKQTLHLGHFATAEEAACARASKEKELFTHSELCGKD